MTEHFSREGIREFRCQLSRIIDGIPDMAFFGIRSESFGLPHNSLIYWINVNWIFCLYKGKYISHKKLGTLIKVSFFLGWIMCQFV